MKNWKKRGREEGRGGGREEGRRGGRGYNKVRERRKSEREK